MTCIKCRHIAKRFGSYPRGGSRVQRYRCPRCEETFSELTHSRVGDHYIQGPQVEKALSMILEGMSIRATSRLTGLHKDTILSLIRTVGTNCLSIFNTRVRDIQPNYVQADEMWGFIHTKKMRLRADDPAEWGDTYLWLALDSETKLIITYRMGLREARDAHEFIQDLRLRTRSRFQLTTDGLRWYLEAVQFQFGERIDFAQTLKVFKPGPKPSHGDFKNRTVVGIKTHTRIGNPDPAHISTSHMERANLTVRMHLRRFTRSTNGFSKKLANLKDAVNLYVTWYNFCRVHSTLRITPAMAAGITDHIWELKGLMGAATGTSGTTGL